jgi:DNA-3-methyladenine glycosylase II
VVNQALNHFKAVDPVLFKAGQQVKHLLTPIDPKPTNQYFVNLCENIIGQQLSGKAADTIWGRIVQLVGKILPENILAIHDENFRAAGCSWAKIKYIKDLANKNLDFSDFPELSDTEIKNRLIEVKGIGPWTAEMFLIFTMGRPDVFSYGDLGLKNAMKKLPGLQKPEMWSPYRSYACRILWKSLDI